MPRTRPAPRRRTRSRSFARLTAFSLVAALAGCAGAPLAPLPEGNVAFGILGDAPYNAEQVERLDRLIDDLNRDALAFVVHVGDIGSSTRAQACGDDWLAARKKQFGRIRAPFVLIPGDNEWSDCHGPKGDPLVRLAKWRKAFCIAKGLQVERQGGEYCEHMRWRSGDTLFVTLNVPGNNNNARMPEEHAARMKAVLAWIDEAEKLAPARLVLLTQANPFVPRTGFTSFLDRLERLGRRMPGRVYLLHGDTHVYRDDEPFPGLRRLEVWGSPFVSWVRVRQPPAGSTEGLRFEPGPQY